MNALLIPNCLDGPHGVCRAVVETPAGHRSRFDYDPTTGLFELAGVLPAGMSFPLAFGFIPSTRAQDGDPVDVLILADDELPVGCLVTIRLLGVIEAWQTEGGDIFRNDRVIARVAQSRAFADVEDLSNLGEAFIAELSHFFVTMNDLKGRYFDVKAVGDAQTASDFVQRAQI